MSRTPDPGAVRDAVDAVAAWLGDGTQPTPDRAALGTAVRLTARALASSAPGASVEVRIPPFVAVQCMSGPRHTRGTPPNVVETDPRSWLLLATGRQDFDALVADGRLRLSGSRAADIATWFPLIGPGAGESSDTSRSGCPNGGVCPYSDNRRRQGSSPQSDR